MIRRILLTALILAVLSPLAFAGDDGGTESVFNLGAGARAMGMGNAYSAVAEDATAVYYNPAGMPYISSQQVSFLHTILFESTIYDYIAYVNPYSRNGAFGIAAMRIGTDDIERRDEYTDLGRFSASRMQFLLSYGHRFGKRFSSGLNLKLAHQSIDDYSAYGYGLDLAGRVNIMENLYGGLLLQDIVGARMKLASVKERTPFTIRTGLAYKLKTDKLPLSGTVALDLDKPENRNVKLRTGLEVVHNSGLSIRGGYDRDNFTLGLGIVYQKLDFDYAYKFIDHLSDSHRFSLSFRFGITRTERRARQAEQLQRSKASYIEADRMESFRQELDKADRFFEAGMLDSALVTYYRADAYAEGRDKEHIGARIDTIMNLKERESEEPVGIQPSGAGADDIIRQATTLMEKGSLKAARDVIDAAIANGVEAAELYVLRRELAFRIDSEITRLLRSAEATFDKGNYIDAYDEYNRALNLDPGNKQARDGSRAAKIQIDVAQHLKLAMDYYDQERYVLSQREFNSVLHLDPGNETARRMLRDINDRMNETGTPEERDLRQDEEMWQVYLDGVEAYRAGDYKKAIELWNRVLKKYPADQMTLENKRQAELRVKD